VAQEDKSIQTTKKGLEIPVPKRRDFMDITHCGQHVHPTAGTIFHKSSTSLHLWFYANRTNIRVSLQNRQVHCNVKSRIIIRPEVTDQP